MRAASTTCHVALVSDDPQLTDVLRAASPQGVGLHVLSPNAAQTRPLPAIRRWWVDLDAATPPPVREGVDFVYFFSEATAVGAKIQPGLQIRKPCSPAIARDLWGDVMSSADNQSSDREPDSQPADSLPAWALDLHELDRRALCHKIVTRVARHLGGALAAVYLFEPRTEVLTLAESRFGDSVDLAVCAKSQPKHLLAFVASCRRIVSTADAARYCRRQGLDCPAHLATDDAKSAILAPLHADDRVEGVLVLAGIDDAARKAARRQLSLLMRFLGRSLQHARRFQHACVEGRIDRLTGLANYRGMIEAIEKEVARAKRHQAPFTLLMADLDGLKSVNDRFGHVAGNALIRHAAGQITKALRRADSAGRVGGDEFLILLPATTLKGAKRVAKRILSAAETDAPRRSGELLPFGISIGVAQWHADQEAQQIIEAADRAMYAAKRAGRSRTTVFNTEPPRPPTPIADRRACDADDVVRKPAPQTPRPRRLAPES